MTAKAQTYPYGLWPSSISAAQIAKRIRLEDVQWSPDGQSFVWIEGRSSGSVLVSQTGNEARKDLTDEHNPRGGVGYGGGAFSVGRMSSPEDSPGTAVVFAERDGGLYRVSLEYDRPRPLTPAFGSVAAPVLSPNGEWVVYAYTKDGVDVLGIAPASGSAWPVQLSRGADFYMQPAWHPSSKILAWVEWDNPNMPWDGSRVQLAGFDFPDLNHVLTIAGGADVPASQPAFSPDGRWISFIEEAGEWPNLVLFDLKTKQRRILIEGQGFELAPPAWIQGMRSYGWDSTSRRIFYLRYQGPFTTLWVVDLETGQSIQVDTAPYTWLSQLAVSPTRDAAAFIASAANIPDRIVEWDGTRTEESRLRTIARSGLELFPPDSLAIPREFSWPAPDGTPVHALYYPPTNPGCAGQGLPPAIVHVHGGPTSIANARYSSEAVYFTSRGYAWVELNYRGSTGYGRTYRNALRSGWGRVDVEDAAGCAQALSQQGLADSTRLVINGGSAGGYTVLNTLIRHPGLYKAGNCQYGVSNLFTIDLDTHKFEKHYNAHLVGPLPDAADKYRAWSPVFNASSIQDALYIFQGVSDPVVPPSQSEKIVEILRRRGVPHKYKLYEGEGHGFRKPETIIDYLQETEKFLQQYVLFT
jgi:dipeptidyl aminopeptidase/acylaminoacyl peptidase